MVIIAAPNKERCREISIGEFFIHEEVNEFDNCAEFTVIEGVNHPEGVVKYVYGGGLVVREYRYYADGGGTVYSG